MKLTCEECGQEVAVPEGETPPRACPHCSHAFPLKGTRTTPGMLRPLGRNQEALDPAAETSPAPKTPAPKKKILKKLKPKAPLPAAPVPAVEPQVSATDKPAPAVEPQEPLSTEASPDAAPKLRPLGQAKPAPNPAPAPAAQATSPAGLRPLGDGAMTSGRGENSKLDDQFQRKPIIAPEAAAGTHENIPVAKPERMLGVDEPAGPSPETPPAEPRSPDKLKAKASKFETVAPLGGDRERPKIDADAAAPDARIDPKPSETGSRLKVDRSGRYVGGEGSGTAVRKNAKILYLTVEPGVLGVLHPVEQALRQTFRGENLVHHFETPDETGQKVGELREDDVHIHLRVAASGNSGKTAALEAHYRDGTGRERIFPLSGRRLPDSTPERLVVQMNLKALKGKIGYPVCKLVGERTVLNKQALQFVTASFILGLLCLVPYAGYVLCLPGLVLGVIGLAVLLGRKQKRKRLQGCLAILLNLAGPVVSTLFSHYLPIIQEALKKASG